mmetsp:Transcript_120411/g.374939  ORF Transcript_120411/g.374939 Transcript_120411/m.374939 type:complete len:190 (-) Transcript_120411:75-644(-)
MSSGPFFFIGARSVSKPFSEGSDEWPTVDMVVMKPCVCGGFNSLDAESKIPRESLTALGLEEGDVRGAMRDVSDTLKRRTRCCWYWGLCGPFMLIIWWLDMCLQQCSIGITKRCCQIPAMRKVEAVLAEHNEKLKATGVAMSVVPDQLGVTTTSMRNNLRESMLLRLHTDTVHLDTWLIQVQRLGPAGP